MNKIFQDLSLAAGGSHYPTINPDLQQRFGELIIDKVLDIVHVKIEASHLPVEVAALSELKQQILDQFELQWMDPDWDAEAELQKIFDEFDIGNKN